MTLCKFTGWSVAVVTELDQHTRIASRYKCPSIFKTREDARLYANYVKNWRGVKASRVIRVTVRIEEEVSH